MKLVRNPGESVEAFCFRIYNVFGFRDLCLQITNTMPDGNVVWSKKLRYDNLMCLEPWRWVTGTYFYEKKRAYTRNEFIEAATHRSVIDIEIMIDLDDSENIFLELEDIKQKAELVAWNLKQKDLSIYFTGNKSYHISYIEPKLRTFTPEGRRKYKENIIMKQFGDLDMCNPTKMISMEGAIHYRSGLRKERVEL